MAQPRGGLGLVGVLSPAIVVCVAGLLTAFACNAGHASMPGEDCSTPGDEDDNGLADCSDPACADAPACRPACGNGRRDPGEACDDGNAADGDGCESDCTLPACGNGIGDAGETCDDGNAANGDGCSATCTTSTITYVKASNTGDSDQFGTSVALSADGSTLAVGAPLEDSASPGINGDQSDGAAHDAGAVYVYTRDGKAWHQQAYVKASNPRANALFGFSLALSADGSTLAVGAYGEASGATGVNHDQTDSSAPMAGAVYVFARRDTAWHQEAYVKASNTRANATFGMSVALSADGVALAVGAVGEASAASGIEGDQGDQTAASAGAVYVFTRSGSTWAQQAYVKASNTDAGDNFGSSVALSADATTLAVGSINESSMARGIGSNQRDNSAPSAGAVYVFTRAGTTWGQQAYVKASNTDSADNFGASVALSADGATLAVGAYGEDSAATGIDGDQNSNAVLEAGAAYVFVRAGTTWSQQAYVKASNTGVTNQFGWGVALSPDGSMMAVASLAESSAATGIGGDQTSASAFDSGAAYRFRRTGTRWGQEAYIKASNTGIADEFGSSIALAADGTVAAGAAQERGAATGIGGNQADNSLSSAGAVYVVQ